MLQEAICKKPDVALMGHDMRAILILRKLSAQFETEQRRHTEQVEALQQRVDQHTEQVEALQQRVDQQTAQSETLRRQIVQLTGHVTGLNADYKTIAATLREWWS